MVCDLLTSSGRVFDQLEYTRNHSGLFLFLEEDHYMVPDFLHVLKLMSDARPQRCPTCNILSLGTYLKAPNYRTDSSRVSQLRVGLCRRMSCLSYDLLEVRMSLQWLGMRFTCVCILMTVKLKRLDLFSAQLLHSE